VLYNQVSIPGSSTQTAQFEMEFCNCKIVFSLLKLSEQLKWNWKKTEIVRTV